MNISVFGCGRWGSFIAWYLRRTGSTIKLYGREGGKIEELKEKRANSLLSLHDSVLLTSDISQAAEFGDLFVISIASQGLRSLLMEIGKDRLRGKTVLLCMKGLEQRTGLRLSEVVDECSDNSAVPAIWVGPGHVQDFLAGIPNCMVIDSNNVELKAELVDLLQSDLIRFYYGTDLIGNEIGAAAKNVVGIAAGMLDGLGKGALKGALMSRGTREIARLIKALGGNEITAYGLSHLGDYEATVFSRHSHNRRFGEALVKNEKYEELAEGVYTVKALLEISETTGVELPICMAVGDVIYKKTDPVDALSKLFLRSLKDEFY